MRGKTEMDHTKVGSDNGNWMANVRTQWRALCKRCCVNGFNYHTVKLWTTFITTWWKKHTNTARQNKGENFDFVWVALLEVTTH